VYDNLKKTILYLLPAGRCVIVLRCVLWQFILYMLWMSSFSELMPIVLNVVIGVPQMLSNIQMILICVGVSAETLFLPGFIFRALWKCG
jgi:sodium/potassium-transporting ATPase subunit alpha